MKKILIGLQACILGLLVIAAWLFWQDLANEAAIAEDWVRKDEAYRLADTLRQSSDDLTRMARTYAVTGDERYRQYFQEILDIRNGVAPRPLDYHLVYWDLVTAEGARPRPGGEPAALRELMVEAGFTPAELAMLEEAENESTLLTNLENEAFMAVQDGDRDLAQELLHSNEYHLAKERVMMPILGFFQVLTARIEDDVRMRIERRARLNRTLFAVVVSVIALSAISLLLTARPDAD